MSDLSEPESCDEYGGIWDDAQTALRWSPILPLLKNLEKTSDLIGRAKAIKELAAFAIKTGFHTDPYSRRGFLIYCKFIELIEKDKQWREIVSDLLK